MIQDPNPMMPFTPFLPTTSNIPEENDRMKAFLQDIFAQYADVINDKKIGIYEQADENQNGEKWYFITPRVTRNGYQAIAYIPSYPNATVLTLDLTSDPTYPIPDVNPEFVITSLHGTASKPCTSIGAGDGDYLQFLNQGDSRISFNMSDTTITITTTIDMTAYSGFIVVEYIRNGF